MLQAVGSGLFSPALPGAAPAARVRVTGLEVFRIPVNRRGAWVLVRVSTSQGLTGIGDASHGYPDERTIQLVRQFFEVLRGRSVFEIEWLRQRVQEETNRHRRPAVVALSALEQCLFDIQGKALGVPCSALFGGRLRDKVRTYANINRATEDRTPAGFAGLAERAVQAGFDAIKLAPFDGMPRTGSAAEIERFTRLGIECAAAVRKVIGPDRDLLIDVHNTMNLERGLELARRLEPLNLFWLEEVTRPLVDLAAINRAARMPTAGGESIHGVKGFYPYIAAGAVDIVMPDVKYCGGMLELKKISVLAEAAGLLCSPHGPASPVGNLAAAHVSATLPNFQILEFAFGEAPWRAELIEPAEVVAGGYQALGDRPGLGAVLNEAALRKHGTPV